MKIRIKGNSLRYRLTRSDISSLVNNGLLEEKTDFPGQTLTYAIRVDHTTQQLHTSYSDHRITLFLSPAMVRELADTDKVGFEEKGGTLPLLVEKDFTCLDNVEEDQSDNFPNPLALGKN